MDRSVLFVVNPDSRGRKTGKTWPKVYDRINSILTLSHDAVIADGIGSGIEATLNGIDEGYNTIVSVGGEGTNNEIANGIYRSGRSDVSLGFIKSGTANDYLTVIDWPDTLEDQLALIESGKTISTPLTKVTGDSVRYSLNVADTGIGAAVAYMASVERRLTWIRFDFRYTLLALLGIKNWQNIPLEMKLDDRKLTGDLSFFMAGFSTLSGKFKVLPQAEMWGSQMAYTVAMDFGKWRMLRVMNTLKRGEHSEDIEGVFMGYASKIEINAEKPLLFEVDGEPFSFDTSQITIEAVPNAIPVISTQ